MIKPSIGQVIELQELSHTVGEGANWYTHLGGSSVLSNQFKEVHTMAHS